MTMFHNGDTVKYIGTLSVRTGLTGKIIYPSHDNGYMVFFPQLNNTYWCREIYLSLASKAELDDLSRLEYAMKYL